MSSQSLPMMGSCYGSLKGFSGKGSISILRNTNRARIAEYVIP